MPHVIAGHLKDYDWGVVDGLVPWLGRSTGGPQAELWFGVHASGPAPVLSAHGESSATMHTGTVPATRTLDDLVQAEDAPLLVKILAAGRPLSVQVHPNAALASAVFHAQGEPGAAQVYADPFEKTELLFALTPFTAFCGWRGLEDAAAILDRVVGAEGAAALVRQGERLAAVRALLALPDRDAAVGSLPAALVGHRDREAFERVRVAFPHDAGQLLLVLLDVETLAPGDAVYVPAGVPHSYLHGIGVEVMTSSDNVVRLGLTNKPVFVEQAMDALSESAAPTVLRSRDAWVAPTGAPFALRPMTPGHEEAVKSGGYRVVLALSGSTEVVVDDAVTTLAPGQALVLTADEPPARVRTQAQAVIVAAAHGQEDHE